jgi:hypothetical protein
MDPIERIKAMQDIENQINRMNEYITGTTTDSIADSITDGFQRGLGSAELFADTFEDLMRNAMLSSFKQDIISSMLKPFYDQFATLAEGGLTSEEIDSLRQMFTGVEIAGKGGGSWHYPGIADSIQEAYDAMASVLQGAGIDMLGGGGSSTMKTGLAGQIQGITEQTAGALEGQLNAMRIDVRMQRGILENMNDGKMMPILNAIREIRNATYYMDELYAQGKASALNMNAMLGRMDDILISNLRIADNTEYNGKSAAYYLSRIQRRLDNMASTSSGTERAIGV